MSAGRHYVRLAEALRDRRDTILDAWTVAFDRSWLRVPRPVEERECRARIRAVIDGLAVALPEPDAAEDDSLRPGSPQLRELEKAAGFIGGSMAATGASGFDVGAALVAVRDVAGEYIDPEARERFRTLFEWLTIVALDSFGTAGALAAREKVGEELERGTPLAMITHDIPAVLFVGAPDGSVVDSIFGRLILQAVRVGARALLVDVSGLVDPGAASFLEAARRFLDHRKVADLEVLVIGLPDSHARAWRDMAGAVALRCFDRFDDAVARALDVSGYQLRAPRV